MMQAIKLNEEKIYNSSSWSIISQGKITKQSSLRHSQTPTKLTSYIDNTLVMRTKIELTERDKHATSRESLGEVFTHTNHTRL